MHLVFALQSKSQNDLNISITNIIVTTLVILIIIFIITITYRWILLHQNIRYFCIYYYYHYYCYYANHYYYPIVFLYKSSSKPRNCIICTPYIILVDYLSLIHCFYHNRHHKGQVGINYAHINKLVLEINTLYNLYIPNTLPNLSMLLAIVVAFVGSDNSNLKTFDF